MRAQDLQGITRRRRKDLTRRDAGPRTRKGTRPTRSRTPSTRISVTIGGQTVVVRGAVVDGVVKLGTAFTP